MAKIFVILTAGKDDMNRVNMGINFAMGAKKNAGADVSLMFLGRGVEILMKDAMYFQQMSKQIEGLKSAGVELSYCTVSVKNLGLSEQMLYTDGIKGVMGGVETVKKVSEGYTPITF
ncbi:DsrE family protein [Sulfuracidifex tepidarius]|uniref:Uncharacterized protein n=1 Tax=Sulfuracidifex tepidarius TaxID=1294262 RepID=A0A510DUJ3_9CREN|nr:DsrE family protein [Sulfuracidifex tepidarius]BBG23896.1 hypothetical protein IC006_1193 [Sulfuracidifex tepidarius]BBG26651.1 hypothetical protein IC007_1168 [Sulfuracidifex tepidarius]